VKEWNKDKLLKWILQERPKLLDDDDVEKFEEAKISYHIQSIRPS